VAFSSQPRLAVESRPLISRGFECTSIVVTIELPDEPLAGTLTPQELRLELACALYGRGRIGKIAGSRLAGVDFFAFQRALGERSIPLYTEKMLADDLATLGILFPT
jgi:predicted HTH domain antitoxin